MIKIVYCKYLTSIFSKLDLFFMNKSISNIIYFKDQDDEKLEDLIFLETLDHHVAGIYIDGANPYFSPYMPDNIDTFNLFSKYDELNRVENKRIPLSIQKIRSLNSNSYNEQLGLYLSDEDEKNSLFILFLQDTLCIEYDRRFEQCIPIMQDTLKHIPLDDISCYENRSSKPGWTQIALVRNSAF